MQDATAGDPMTELKWTHKSLRKLCRALRRQGFHLGRDTLARLLREQRFLLRTNRKCQAGTHHPDRDRQFRYLAQQRRRFLKNGWPVISVDAKKKELVGNFKNPGRCYRRHSRKVLDHDFRRYAVGVGIPYGIYDEGRNAGYVRIGTSHETAAFAVATIRQWWLEEGRYRYPNAKHWLQFIRRTRSNTGFHCRASLDETVYALKRKISAEEKASVNLRPRKALPQWNYVIRPHRVSVK